MGVNGQKVIRWGFIGAGNMASKLAGDLQYADGNVCAGVAAREISRAATFASRFGGEAFASYEALVASPDVDVVHIATTHPHHLAHAVMAIEAGKAVLVEKPFALNARQARTILDAAQAQGVFVMEAMWMRLNPLFRRLHELVAEGAIGEVRSVRAEWGLGRSLPPTHRLLDLANGGGALLDLAIYPMTFAHSLIGSPDEQHVDAHLAEGGADETVAVQWRYDDGRDAQLWASVPVHARNRASIRGTEGWLETTGSFHRPSAIILASGDRREKILDPIAGQGIGYGPQIDEVARCLRHGLTESPLVSHADTVAIMELLDDARARIGVVYPGEHDE